MIDKLYGLLCALIAIFLACILVISLGFRITSNYADGRVVAKRILEDERLNTYRVTVKFTTSEHVASEFIQNYYIDHGLAPEDVKVQYYYLGGMHSNIVGQNNITISGYFVKVLGIALFVLMSIFFLNKNTILKSKLSVILIDRITKNIKNRIGNS